MIPDLPLEPRAPDESGVVAACRASLGCCCPGSHPARPTCPVAEATVGLSSVDRSGVRSGHWRRSRALTTPGSLVRRPSVLVPVKAGSRRPETSGCPGVRRLVSTMCDGLDDSDGSRAGAVGVGLPSARRTVATRERQPKWGAGDWPPADRLSGDGVGHVVTFCVAADPALSPEVVMLAASCANVDTHFAHDGDSPWLGRQSWRCSSAVRGGRAALSPDPALAYRLAHSLKRLRHRRCPDRGAAALIDVRHPGGPAT